MVSGHVRCWNCQADIEVICLYCQTGFVDGEAMFDFSVSNVTDIDESLRLQLARWPKFPSDTQTWRRTSVVLPIIVQAVRKPRTTSICTASREEYFFSFQDPVAQELQIHALQGLVRFSGDEGFEP